MRKTITIMLAVLISLMVLRVSRASPEQWTELTRFTGSADQNTACFTCTHNEWRIIWIYTPKPTYPTMALFTYAAESTAGETVSSIYQSGNEATSGFTYIHDKPGTFFLSISIVNIASYTIIIQQDLDSIPEYPVGLLFAMLTIAIVVATAIKHRARFKAS